MPMKRPTATGRQHHARIRHWLRLLDAVDELRLLLEEMPDGTLASNQEHLANEYACLLTGELLDGRPKRTPNTT